MELLIYNNLVYTLDMQHMRPLEAAIVVKVNSAVILEEMGGLMKNFGYVYRNS